MARSPEDTILKRRQRLYRRQTEGLPARALVLDHAATEGIAESTAWEDWKQVKNWNQEDWAKEREVMLPRLQAMRLRLFNNAMRAKNFQTAAQVLDSLGKVIGESVEQINIQAPELSIKVEPKSHPES